MSLGLSVRILEHRVLRTECPMVILLLNMDTYVADTTSFGWTLSPVTGWARKHLALSFALLHVSSLRLTSPAFQQNAEQTSPGPVVSPFGCQLWTILLLALHLSVVYDLAWFESLRGPEFSRFKLYYFLP